MKKYILILTLFFSSEVFAQEIRELAFGKATAVIDLRSNEGVKLANSQWKSLNTQIVTAKFNAPGPSEKDKMDIYPTGKEIQTNTLEPRFGTPAFEQANWENVAPTDLEIRHGNGLLSHVWYKLKVTIPAKVGSFSTENSRAIFEIVADDYSEVWINGRL